MITNTIINYYQLYDFISLRCKKCCYLFGFFLVIIDSNWYWFLFYSVLLNFFFDICHVVNNKFIGWYIMYFCHPVFFSFKNLQRGISITILYCSSCSTANRIQKQKHNRIITHTEVTTDGWRQFFSKQWRVLVGSLFCCYGKTGSCRREKLAWRCLKSLCP